MKRLLTFGLSLGLVAALAVPAAAFNGGASYKLIAGQNETAGTVKISGNYTVEINLDPGWCMTAAHVDQGESAGDHPKNRAGNPQIGRFDFNRTYDSCVKTDTFSFVGGQPFFAVHADVVKMAAPSTPWATEVVSEAQGLRKDFSPVPAARSIATNALIKDYVAGGAETFFSLGRDGKIVVGFDCKVLNLGGNDLKIWEVTNGTYPTEKAKVSVSQDGETWFPLGTATNAGSGANRSTAFSAEPLPWFKYVKLVDDTDYTQTFGGAPADGFDVDGVEALQKCVGDFETAWGEGTPFGGGSWAMYIEYDPAG